MKFSAVAASFDRIENVSGRVEITKLLADLFKLATPEEVEILCNLSLGQLHPPFEGTTFSMAEKSLVSVVAQLTGQSPEAVKKQMKALGDIGNVLTHYEWPIKKELSVEQVYNELCALEKESGAGSQERKTDMLEHLLSSLDPVSAKYVARMVVGKLRLGFSDMTIIDALSWMEEGDKKAHKVIEEAYNVCADLGLIGKKIREGGIGALKKVTITLGIPVRPAAAERAPNAEKVIEKIGSSVAQPKLDGFRLQIHVDRTKAAAQVHFFSRHLQDMSAMFPDLLKPFKELPVKTLICEGEAIGYNTETQDFLPFQETAKRRRKHDIEQTASAFPLRVFLFDILYLDGQDLMSMAHEQRREKLIAMMKGVSPDKIAVIAEKPVSSAQDLEDYFEQELAAGLEGLVVKKTDAPYQPGKRNFNWIKLKRVSQGHLEDTIDCVILGYYQGAGKRVHFGIGAFLVGVYNKRKDCFQTIAKVGTGLKDDEWRALKKRCDALAIDDKPRNVECAKELTPDVWVIPELVCAIFADEITLSPLHTANKTDTHSGFALRFPRILGYRDDKQAPEATEVNEIQRLYDDQY